MRNMANQNRKILLFSLATIVVTFIAAWIGFSIFESQYPNVFEIWRRWDTRMYLRIAEVGYQNTREGMFLITVLPLYPFTVRLLSILVNNTLIASLVVSNAFYVIALLVLYKLVKLDFSDKVAWRTIFYMSIFPAAYFLHAGYSESMFIAFVVIATYFARKEKWVLAGSFGALGVLTRITGVVLIPYLLMAYLESKKFNFRKIKSEILFLLLPIFGFVTYLYINFKIFGNPLQFLTSLRIFFWEWPSLPWQGLVRAITRFNTLPPEAWMIEGGMVLLFWVFCICLLIYSIKKIRLSYSIFAWLSFIFVSATTTWSSLPRFMLTFFPIFISLALIGKSKINKFLITYSFIFLQSIFLILYVREHWAF